jgi:hypothetical protein
MVANTKDGSIPHTTDFHFHFWVGAKSQLSITHIGKGETANSTFIAYALNLL